MEDAVVWGNPRGGDGLVAEFHRIGYFLCLGVVWYHPLESIMI